MTKRNKRPEIYHGAAGKIRLGQEAKMWLLDVDVPAPLELVRRAALPRPAVVSFPISPTLLILVSHILGRQPP